MFIVLADAFLTLFSYGFIWTLIVLIPGFTLPKLTYLLYEHLNKKYTVSFSMNPYI